MHVMVGGVFTYIPSIVFRGLEGCPLLESLSAL